MVVMAVGGAWEVATLVSHYQPHQSNKNDLVDTQLSLLSKLSAGASTWKKTVWTLVCYSYLK
jgi:hypothetical protein